MKLQRKRVPELLLFDEDSSGHLCSKRVVQLNSGVKRRSLPMPLCIEPGDIVLHEHGDTWQEETPVSGSILSEMNRIVDECSLENVEHLAASLERLELATQHESSAKSMEDQCVQSLERLHITQNQKFVCHKCQHEFALRKKRDMHKNVCNG